MTEAEWLACPETIPMLGHLGARLEQRKTLLLTAACFATVYSELPGGGQAWCDLLTDVTEGRARASELFNDWPTLENHLFTFDGTYGEGGGRFYSLLNLALKAGGLALDHVERGGPAWEEAEAEYAELVRDIFGNPFRPVTFDPNWRTSTAIALAQQMYDSRDFAAMPILADALQDAGCDNADILDHCHKPGPHVRGCWVVDWVLGKEEKAVR